jgi:hypothetical protein
MSELRPLKREHKRQQFFHLFEDPKIIYTGGQILQKEKGSDLLLEKGSDLLLTHLKNIIEKKLQDQTPGSELRWVLWLKKHLLLYREVAIVFDLAV